MADLRAVKDGEAPVKPKTISEAAAGTRRELLVSMRARVAKALDDPKCPPRDLASLTRRLQDIANEIEAIDSEKGGDSIGEAATTPDEAFDPEAI